jgi:hypothetical protein
MVASVCPGADMVTPVKVTTNVKTLAPFASATATVFASAVLLTLVVRVTPPLVNVSSVLPPPPPLPPPQPPINKTHTAMIATMLRFILPPALTSLI